MTSSSSPSVAAAEEEEMVFTVTVRNATTARIQQYRTVFATYISLMHRYSCICIVGVAGGYHPQNLRYREFSNKRPHYYM